jgi:AraC-like DNA-binding protein
MTTPDKFSNITTSGFRLFSFRSITDHGAEQKGQDFFTVIKTFEPIDIVVENERYDLKANQMIFVGPGRSIDLSNARMGNGYVLCFTAAFYERSVEDAAAINSPMFFGEGPFLYHDSCFSECAFNQQIVCRLRRAEVQGDHLLDLVAHHCVESLLLDVYHKVSAGDNRRKKRTDIGLVNHFSILIHKHCREYTHVQFYADQLHVTARRLTDICLAMTGKTAKSMILSVVVQQAVRYIKYTNLSISQISYEMGFNDESNFRNFVKKQTGYIPRALREN